MINDNYFNINNLITKKVSDLLKKTENKSEVIYILLDLLDFNGASSTGKITPEIIDELNMEWEACYNEKYKPIFLNRQHKEIIVEYSNAINDFNKTKKMINKLVNNLDSDNIDYIIQQYQDEINEKNNEIAANENFNDSFIIEDIEFDEIYEDGEFKTANSDTENKHSRYPSPYDGTPEEIAYFDGDPLACRIAKAKGWKMPND